MPLAGGSTDTAITMQWTRQHRSVHLPWHHYHPQALVATGAMDYVGFGVLLAWSVCGTVLAAAVFARRDLV